MLRTSRSLWIRIGRIFLQVIHILVIFSMVLESLSITSKVSANHQQEPNVAGEVTQALPVTTADKLYQPPVYKHPQALLGQHKIQDNSFESSESVADQMLAPRFSTATIIPSPTRTSVPDDPTITPTPAPSDAPDNSTVITSDSEKEIFAPPSVAVSLQESDQVSNNRVASDIESVQPSESDPTTPERLPIVTGVNIQQQPLIVYNSIDEEYLLIWVDTSTSPQSIKGMRVSVDGESVSDEFIIANSSTGTPASMEIAYNNSANSYMLVWREGNGQVYSKKYCEGNCVISELDLYNFYSIPLNHEGHPSIQSPNLISQTARQVAVVYNSEDNLFVLGWSSPSGGEVPCGYGLCLNDTHIELVKISNIGVPVEPSVNIVEATYENFELAYNPTNNSYFVQYDVWLTKETGGTNQYGKIISSSFVYQPAIVITNATGFQWAPRVSYQSDNTYLVTWFDQVSDFEPSTLRVDGKIIDASYGYPITVIKTLVVLPYGYSSRPYQSVDQNFLQSLFVGSSDYSPEVMGLLADDRANIVSPFFSPISAAGNDPKAAGDSNGNWLITWEYAGDIYIRHAHIYKGVRGEAVYSSSCPTDCPQGSASAATGLMLDPVNTLTGGLSEHVTDISIQTSSGPLSFERFYSSLATSVYQTTLGYGWTHNLDTRLIIPEQPNGIPGYVYFKGRSANLYRFKINSDGSYSPAEGVIGNLSCSGAECELSLPNLEKYTFGGTLLRTWSDGKGSVLEYSYINGRISQISDPNNGRYLSLVYNSLGRIATVSDSTGRSVSYSYSGSGDLATVTDLRGTWTYEYVSHFLTKIIDPLGHVVMHSNYDSKGRVTRQYASDGTSLYNLNYDGFGKTTITDVNGKTILHSYDENGTLTGITDKVGHNLGKSYDQNFRPTSNTDENGNITHLTWSEDGANLLQVENSLGQLTTLNYDSNSNISSTVDSANFLTQYFYEDTLHPTLLTRSIDALGAEMTYAYDSNGHLTSTTDPLGHTTQYGYDQYGQRTSFTNALNQTTTYTYDSVGRVIDTTSSEGRVSHNVFDNAGNLLQSIQNYVPNKVQNQENQYNITTTYTYDLMGRQLSVTDTFGRTTSYTYDDNGQLLTTTDPAGNLTSNTYNVLGQLTSTIDIMGRETKYEYDSVGRLVKTTDPAGHSTRSEYNPDGSLSATIDSGGQRTTYIYDDLGRVTSTTDAEGNTTHTTYNSAGNVETATDAEGNVTSYEYDALGRQIKQVFDDGSFIETFYDEVGNRIQSIDAMGNATTYSYDELNRLTTSTDALGNATQYSYNASGQQASITDPAGNVTSYQYDSLGRQILVALPDGATSSTTYDALGNVVTSTDAKNQTTTNTYDTFNRLISTTDTAGNVVSYTYDKAGNRLSLTNANGGKTDYAYNELGQMVKETNPLGKSTTYEYDANGNLTKVTDADHASTTYEYDKIGRQTKITNALGVSISYGYDDNGNRTSMKDGKNTITRYEYNSQGMLTAVIESSKAGENGDQDTNVRTEYSYDANGNRTKITDAKGHETNFTYDDLNRLTSETDALGNTTSYGYDTVGNQTSMTDALGRTTSYTYNSRGLLININYPDPDPDVTFSYDANGQRVSMQDGVGTTTWTLDSLGRASSISDPFGATVGYTYDAAGNRTGMTYPDGKQVVYEYDDANRLTSVTDWANRITSYSYSDTNLVEMILRPYGLVTLIDHDEIGQTTSMQTTQSYKLLNSFEYTYDGNGNRTKVKEHLDLPERIAPAVTVTVLDEAGSPVVNQVVTAYSGGIKTSYSAITDTLGIARVIAPDGLYRFGTELHGAVYYSAETDSCLIKTCISASITMPVFQEVTVTVKDENGEPISDANISVYRDGQTTDLTGTSVADGTTSFLLIEGNYSFRVEKENDFIITDDEIACSVPGCDPVSIIFPEFHDVSIFVGDLAENPQAGMLVTAEKNGKDTGYSGVSDSDGISHLRLPSGDYVFSTVYLGERFDTSHSSCSVPENCEGIKLLISHGQNVVFHIVDADGQPISRIEIWAMNGSDRLDGEVYTNSAGIAVMELPEGSYRFGISDGIKTYFTGAQNHCTIPDCVAIDFQLDRYYSVTLNVSDSEGNPVSNTRVGAFQNGIEVGNLLTDSTGQGSVLLSSGDYQFRLDYFGETVASGEGDHCSVPTCTVSQIVLPASYPVEITVLDYWENPIADQEVFVYDGANYKKGAGITSEQGTTNTYFFEGDYRFAINYHGLLYYSSASDDCSIPTCTNSEIRLPELYPVAVTVQDQNGQIVPNAPVSPYENGNIIAYLQYTNGSGQAEFYLPPADFTFGTSRNTFPYYSDENNACSLPSCSSVTIETDIFYPVVVTIRNSNNELMPGIFVALFGGDYYDWTDSNGQYTFELPPGDHHLITDQFDQTYDLPSCTVPECSSIEAIVPSTPYIEVTVRDSAGHPNSGVPVEAYDGETVLDITAETNSEGIVQLPVIPGSYRFKAIFTTSNNVYEYFSGDSNHCSYPACVSASITTPEFGDVAVTVTDSAGNPLENSSVTSYIGDNAVGNSLTTDASGQVTFHLPEGSYRFMSDVGGIQVFSGEDNHCTVPDCTTATIQFTESSLVVSGKSQANQTIGSKPLFSPKFDDTTPVTITVVDTNQQPQPDLTVVVMSGDSEVGIDGTTDSAGQFVVDLPDGNYRVKMEKFGDTYYSADANHCEVPTCNTITAEVPAYGLVSVVVQNTANVPQAGVSVGALDGDDAIGSAEFSGSDGTVVFNLPEGQYRFRATYHDSTYTSGEQNHCSVPECATASITVPTYQPVTVTVSDTVGVPQNGVTVTAYRSASATAITSITDDQGQAVLELTDGEYRFVTSKGGVEASSGTGSTCTIPGCVADNITLPTFSDVTITVVDSASVPQVDIPVFAYSNGTQTGYNGITDSNGQVVLTVPQGNYRFRAETHSLTYFSGEEGHCATPTCTTATIALPQFSDVSVTVQNTINEPLPDLTVYVYRGEENTGFTGVTGQDGVANFTLPEGEYSFHVLVNNLKFATSQDSPCTLPGCSAAQITVPRFGTVEINIRDSAGNIPDIANAYAFIGEHRTEFHDEMKRSGKVTLLLPEASYRFLIRFTLPDDSGEYFFFSGEQNHCEVPACSSVSVSAPEFTPVTLNLVDPTGSPSADTFVSVYQVIPPEEAGSEVSLKQTDFHGTSDVTGQVKLHLPAGTYRFSVELQGRRFYSDPANDLVVPDSVTTNFTVPQIGTVDVTVSDKDGVAQPNQTVFAYQVLEGVDSYSGISGVTDTFGKIQLRLVEGTYKFLTEQYGLSFWSDANQACLVPTCTTAQITVLGSTYTATDQTINYTYDDLNRLTAADYSNTMYYHYEYDSVGNRIKQVSAFMADPVTTEYTYDSANRLATVAGQAYSFDANGNLTGDGTYTYAYDTANRLVGVSNTNGSVNYRYNGLGDRLQQTANGVNTNFNLELNSGLSQVLADGTNTYLYGMNRIGMSNSTGDYLYEYDAIGSVRQMENIAGLSLAESYDPYGNVILASGQTGIYGLHRRAAVRERAGVFTGADVFALYQHLHQQGSLGG